MSLLTGTTSGSSILQRNLFRLTTFEFYGFTAPNDVLENLSNSRLELESLSVCDDHPYWLRI